MKLKDRIYELLSEKPGEYISGQYMADQLAVTRAAVWKAIKSLEKDGTEIEAVTNKGYRIKFVADRIDPDWITNQLKDAGFEIPVIYLDEVDSTNDEIRRKSSSLEGDFLLISNTQSKGRGRRGRDFFSPGGTGLYMSLLLRRHMDSLPILTGIAATAVAKAIDEVVFEGVDTTKIKWVNDIFVNGYKVSGILTEMIKCIEDEEDDIIILGIGTNVFTPSLGFPEDIKKTAGALLRKSDDSLIRSRLASRIVYNLYYYLGHTEESIEIYRSKSNLIGCFVKINSFGKQQSSKKYASVLGISEDYHLIIKYEDGKEDELSSGEVSVVRY